MRRVGRWTSSVHDLHRSDLIYAEVVNPDDHGRRGPPRDIVNVDDRTSCYQGGRATRDENNPRMVVACSSGRIR